VINKIKDKAQDWEITFFHTLCQGNICVDSLAKMGSSSTDALTIWNDCPEQISSLLLDDSLRVTYIRL